MPKRLSRAERWQVAAMHAHDALTNLYEIQQEYQEWYDNLPESLQNSSTGQKLEAVCNIEISGALESAQEAVDADLPLGPRYD